MTHNLFIILYLNAICFQILERESRKSKQKSMNSFIPGVEDIVLIGTEIPLQEKRTRFSLSHDQESIGL